MLASKQFRFPFETVDTIETNAPVFGTLTPSSRQRAEQDGTHLTPTAAGAECPAVGAAAESSSADAADRG